MYQRHVTIFVVIFASLFSICISFPSPSTTVGALTKSTKGQSPLQHRFLSSGSGKERSKRSIRTNPEDFEVKFGPREGTVLSKRPFCSGYRGCVGKRVQIHNKNHPSINANKQDEDQPERIERRQVMMAWPDEAEEKSKRQTMWAWPSEKDSQEKRSAQTVMESARQKSKLEKLAKLYQQIASVPQRGIRQGMVAWPTEEKRGDDVQEEALQNRRKRPFCSPYRGCISAESEAEKRKTRSSLVEEDPQEPDAYDYELVPEDAINFFFN